MLDAGDLPEDLLGRGRDERLDVLRGRARERDEDVRHRHVDLRLLLARRHDRREDAEEGRDQRDERRELRADEEPGDASGDAHQTLTRTS